MRWPSGPVSPFDPGSRVYKCKAGRYRCRDTGKYFNVRTGTLFDNTKVPLRKWFLAMYLVLQHKKGISSVQLAADLGVTQKTAWFMLQRIRACFGQEVVKPAMTDNVQMDETFVGGKNKNRHADKKVPMSRGRAYKDKTPVMGMLSGGKVLFAWRAQIRITLSQPEALAFMAIYERGLIVFTIESADLYTEFDKMALSKPVEKQLNTPLVPSQNILQ